MAVLETRAAQLRRDRCPICGWLSDGKMLIESIETTVEVCGEYARLGGRRRGLEAAVPLRPSRRFLRVVQSSARMILAGPRAQRSGNAANVAMWQCGIMSCRFGRKATFT